MEVAQVEVEERLAEGEQVEVEDEEDDRGDDQARVERLLKQKWVVEDQCRWTIFEDLEDELAYHRRRSRALGSFVRAYGSLREDRDRFEHAGLGLQEAYEQLQDDLNLAVGDVAYWRALAEVDADLSPDKQGDSPSTAVESASVDADSPQTLPGAEAESPADSTSADEDCSPEPDLDDSAGDAEAREADDETERELWRVSAPLAEVAEPESDAANSADADSDAANSPVSGDDADSRAAEIASAEVDLPREEVATVAEAQHSAAAPGDCAETEEVLHWRLIAEQRGQELDSLRSRVHFLTVTGGPQLRALALTGNPQSQAPSQQKGRGIAAVLRLMLKLGIMCLLCVLVLYVSAGEIKAAAFEESIKRKLRDLPATMQSLFVSISGALDWVVSAQDSPVAQFGESCVETGLNWTFQFAGGALN